MNIKTYFVDVVLKQYANFKGRATRKEFWVYFLWWFVLIVVSGIILGFLGSIGSLLSGLLRLALLCPTIAIAVRRMTDVNREWWWAIIPFANLYFAAQPTVNAEAAPAPEAANQQ